MGSTLSSFRSFFGFSQVPTKSVMIGIDNAGKTTILYSLHLGECLLTTPTIGFNVETVTYNNFSLTIWDACGGGFGPRLWPQYFKDATGIILVVDSNDRDRICEVKDHLWRILNLDEFKDLPLLIYANKQDIEIAMLVVEVRDALDLNAIEGREWHIQGASALKGQGIKEGLDWYIAQVKKNMKE